MIQPLIHLIEDDEEFGSYIVELLEDYGFSRVTWSQDGVEGLNAALQEVPDLVILDLNLPTLRGEEICRLLRSSRLNVATRILICSDMPEAKQRELEMLKIGADRYVKKPFDEESFLHDIRELTFQGDNQIKSDDLRKPKEEVTDFDSEITAELIGTKAPAKKDRTEIEETTFEGYQLIKVIGGGASGTVYKAKQIRLERQVAVKVFLKDQDQTRTELDRFIFEAKLMAKLSHPNIITVYDFGQTGYTYYIVMELMAKGSVLDYMETHDLNEKFAYKFVSEIFDAVDFLHQQNIIHRDIKPGNIMITNRNQFKLGDFGISSLHEQRMSHSNDYIVGTRAYMSPELLNGAPASAASDQYALGRTILRFFEGERMKKPRMTLKEIRPDLSHDLSDVIEVCLQEKPENRFPSIKEAKAAFIEALRYATS